MKYPGKAVTDAQRKQRQLFQLDGSVSFVIGHMTHHTLKLAKDMFPDKMEELSNIVKQMESIQKTDRS